MKRFACWLVDKIPLDRLILMQGITLFAIMIAELIIILLSFAFFHRMIEEAFQAILLLTGAGLSSALIVILLSMILDPEEVCGDEREQE